jgi:hypothetical protein
VKKKEKIQSVTVISELSIKFAVVPFLVSVVPKMVDVPVLGYQAFWAEKCASLQSKQQVLIRQYPDADIQYRQLSKVLCDIKDVAGYTPAVARGVPNGQQYSALLKTTRLSPARHCSVLCMGPERIKSHSKGHHLSRQNHHSNRN